MVTLVSLARPVAGVHPALLVGSLLVAAAALRAHPLAILGASVVIGAVAGAVLA